MKILAVRGFGVGSSMILKMFLDKVIKGFGLKAIVENTDLSTVKATITDVHFTGHELLPELKVSAKAPVYPIKKYMDTSEIKAQSEQYLADKGE